MMTSSPSKYARYFASNFSRVTRTVVNPVIPVNYLQKVLAMRRRSP
ncbi:MAG TPA: hypothetical protein V6D35_21590 [Candidatus Sericytochromatia bacterium]